MAKGLGGVDRITSSADARLNRPVPCRAFGFGDWIFMEQAGLAAATHDVSLWALFMQAGLIVKLVMIGLIAASVWTWAIVIDKYVSFNKARRQFDQFESLVPAELDCLLLFGNCQLEFFLVLEDRGAGADAADRWGGSEDSASVGWS